jgi:hypothetical protein
MRKKPAASISRIVSAGARRSRRAAAARPAMMGIMARALATSVSAVGLLNASGFVVVCTSASPSLETQCRIISSSHR